MKCKKIVTERTTLYDYFEKCVKDNFKFLRDMSCSIGENTLGKYIKYTSQTIVLTIYYERVSFEIYLTILHIKEGIQCSIDEIVQNKYHRKYLLG